MTRARQTLALMRLPGRHVIQDSLPDNPSVLRRDAPVNLPPARPELTRRYRRLSLRDVFLGFAGYKPSAHPVHRAIAALSPSDALEVRVGSNRWQLLDSTKTVVGELAGGFESPEDMRCVSATVFAIAAWDRERSEPEYRGDYRNDTWEVVVPELVFEPDS